MNTIVKRQDGTEVKPGETIVSFRGEAWEFLGLTRNNTHVHAKRKNWKQEFYPSVFALEIFEEVSDQ